MFYFTLGNISPKFRSRVNAIKLLAIAKTSVIKKYSMNTVLSPIITDIAKLVCCVEDYCLLTNYF